MVGSITFRELCIYGFMSVNCKRAGYKDEINGIRSRINFSAVGVEGLDRAFMGSTGDPGGILQEGGGSLPGGGIGAGIEISGKDERSVCRLF